MRNAGKKLEVVNFRCIKVKFDVMHICETMLKLNTVEE